MDRTSVLLSSRVTACFGSIFKCRSSNWIHLQLSWPMDSQAVFFSGILSSSGNNLPWFAAVRKNRMGRDADGLVHHETSASMGICDGTVRIETVWPLVSHLFGITFIFWERDQLFLLLPIIYPPALFVQYLFPTWFNEKAFHVKGILLDFLLKCRSPTLYLCYSCHWSKFSLLARGIEPPY